MYSIFKKEDIVNGLNKAIGIVPMKTGSAYLRSLWIEAKDNTLQIMATDAATEFTGIYKAEVKEAGYVGVNAKVFADLISKLPASSPISLKYDEEKNCLNVEQDSRSYKLSTIDPKWFNPLDAFPEENSIIWSGLAFQELIDKSYFCISDDESSENLSCFYMKKIDESIDSCGLNGHQLAVTSSKNDELANILPENGLLLQKKYVAELRKWLTDTDILLNITDTKIFIKNDEQTETLSFKRSFFEYPNHRLFIERLEASESSILKVDRKKMLEALSRISIFNNETEKGTYFSLSSQNLELTAQGQEVGSAKEVLEVEYNGVIEKIAFATKHLRDILENFNSEVVHFKFTSSEGSCGITGENDDNYIVIIMPIKIASTNMYEEEE